MHRLFKPLVFLLAAIPGLRIARMIQTGDLGVNPAETLELESGRAALYLLFAALTVTPLRRLTGWNRVQSVRRMLGLWSFFYAVAHVGMYLVFDQGCFTEIGCQWPDIWQDIVRRRFIFAGMVAFVILLALALTSTKGWIRRLGRNWTRLHRLVYVAAAAAIVHFMWKQKSDYSEPYRWLAVLVVLLGIRLFFAVRKRLAARRAAPRTGSGVMRGRVP